MKLTGNHIMLFAAGLSFAASAARAEEFSFSYVFGGSSDSFNPGTTAVAVFDGTQNGNLITDISNAILILNGTPEGPVYAFGFNTQVPSAGTAVVSMDGTQNNLLFSTTAIPTPGTVYMDSQTGTESAPNGYSYINASFPPGSAWDTMVPGGGDPLNASWTVRDLGPSESAPDGGTTAALLGAGMIGLVALRRKFAKL